MHREIPFISFVVFISGIIFLLLVKRNSEL